MDLTGFDANAVDPAESREPVPAGWYKVVIASSEEKPTKAQTGSYLNLQMQIVDGEHAGRSVYDLLNLNNPNQTAVEIAQRTLSSICRATGVMTPRQSDDLHDKPMMVKVSVKPASNGYDARNEVKEYAPCEKGAASTASAGGKATPPWKR
jgi:hypothetical protein